MKKVICIIWFLLGIILLNAEFNKADFQNPTKSENHLISSKITKNIDLNTFLSLQGLIPITNLDDNKAFEIIRIR